MGRRKRKHRAPVGAQEEEAPVVKAAKAAPMNQGLSALKGMKAAPKKASAAKPKAAVKPVVKRQAESAGAPATGSKEGSPKAYSYEDRVAFGQAFAGVKPLGAKQGGVGKKKKSAEASAPVLGRREALQKMYRAQELSEAEARARLDRLVAGGVQFDVRRNSDGGVEGKRRGAPDRTLRMLAAGDLAPEAHLDLHGEVAAKVAQRVNGFARESHRAGRMTLAIIVGKGRHSEGGQGVLDTAVIKGLTDGGAAPLVEAFATAPERHGGFGAILVRLRHRRL